MAEKALLARDHIRGDTGSPSKLTDGELDFAAAGSLRLAALVGNCSCSEPSARDLQCLHEACASSGYPIACCCVFLQMHLDTSWQGCPSDSTALRRGVWLLSAGGWESTGPETLCSRHVLHQTSEAAHSQLHTAANSWQDLANGVRRTRGELGTCEQMAAGDAVVHPKSLSWWSPHQDASFRVIEPKMHEKSPREHVPSHLRRLLSG